MTPNSMNCGPSFRTRTLLLTIRVPYGNNSAFQQATLRTGWRRTRDLYCYWKPVSNFIISLRTAFIVCFIQLRSVHIHSSLSSISWWTTLSLYSRSTTNLKPQDEYSSFSLILCLSDLLDCVWKGRVLLLLPFDGIGVFWESVLCISSVFSLCPVEQAILSGQESNQLQAVHGRCMSLRTPDKAIDIEELLLLPWGHQLLWEYKRIVNIKFQ